ncbi:MAG TPA: hypothetical protein VHA77_07930 [Xanthobacteraceae bacterium]|jgi:hypothetical protein|nr:hypothetical protein [Xanthobacteraceae bacterium]
MRRSRPTTSAGRKDIPIAAAFDLILGKWGDSATRQDRDLVALAFRAGDGFMVVDAQQRLTPFRDIAETALKRSDVIGTPLAPQVFALVDAIWMGDPRLDDVRSWR